MNYISDLDLQKQLLLKVNLKLIVSSNFKSLEIKGRDPYQTLTKQSKVR